MGWNWLWQGILTNWLAYLLALAGGAMLTWLKLRKPRWAEPVTAGLTAFAIIAVGLYFLKAGSVLPSWSSRTAVTPENIESVARTWLDHFQFPTQVMPATSDNYFGLVAMTGTVPVSIFRPTSHDQTLVFETQLFLSKDQGKVFSGLSTDQQDHVRRVLALELGRLGLSYQLTDPLTLTLARHTPITTGLTEDTFMEQVQLVLSASVVAGAALNLEFERLKSENTHK
jgi:hypothetical protein